MSTFRLSPVAETPTAVEFLYELLKERKVIESISHKSMPTWEEHKAYITNSPVRFAGHYVILDGEALIGQVYISHQRECGIWLMPDARGKGAASWALEELLKRHPGKCYTNVAILNEPALKWWRKMGFRDLQRTLVRDS